MPLCTFKKCPCVFIRLVQCTSISGMFSLLNNLHRHCRSRESVQWQAVICQGKPTSNHFGDNYQKYNNTNSAFCTRLRYNSVRLQTRGSWLFGQDLREEAVVGQHQKKPEESERGPAMAQILPIRFQEHLQVRG